MKIDFRTPRERTISEEIQMKLFEIEGLLYQAQVPCRDLDYSLSEEIHYAEVGIRKIRRKLER